MTNIVGAPGIGAREATVLLQNGLPPNHCLRHVVQGGAQLLFLLNAPFHLRLKRIGT